DLLYVYLYNFSTCYLRHFDVHRVHYFVLLLIYYPHVIPLHLRSFPTRRSSDLSISPTTRSRSRSNPADASARWSCRRRSPPMRRSEEHTSELQSRFDLVCRLLLEKKKHMEW